MAEVLVLIDHDGRTPSDPSLELLTAARLLGEPAAAVAAAPDEGDNLTATLERHGAETIYVAESSEFADVLVTPKSELLSKLVTERAPAAVLVNATLEGKEIAGRLAVRCDSGFLTDVTSLDSDGVCTQSILGGTMISRSRVSRGTAIYAVSPNSFVATEASSGSARTVRIDPAEPDRARAARVVERHERSADDRPALAEAPIVVCGGRGAGGEAGFEALGELADALGAALGASRVATDSGWYPHQHQIGQTGATVSPQLYLAVGVSGAIQHRAGMLTSEVIVAINSDPDAPIFELADFGLVGDMFDVVPSLTAAIRELKRD